jgi:hypothetical protein
MNTLVEAVSAYNKTKEDCKGLYLYFCDMEEDAYMYRKYHSLRAARKWKKYYFNKFYNIEEPIVIPKIGLLERIKRCLHLK